MYDDEDDTAGILADINTTPLIDVMLVLLIMLIITIPMQPDAIDLNLPVTAAEAPPQPPEIGTIAIDAEGAVTWNGDALADRAALEDRLAQVALMPVQPEIHVRPANGTPYRYVTAVLAACQRSGIGKIAVRASKE